MHKGSNSTDHWPAKAFAARTSRPREDSTSRPSQVCLSLTTTTLHLRSSPSFFFGGSIKSRASDFSISSQCSGPPSDRAARPSPPPAPAVQSLRYVLGHTSNATPSTRTTSKPSRLVYTWVRQRDESCFGVVRVINGWLGIPSDEKDKLARQERQQY